MRTRTLLLGAVSLVLSAVPSAGWASSDQSGKQRACDASQQSKCKQAKSKGGQSGQQPSSHAAAGVYQVRPEARGKYGFDWGWSNMTGAYGSTSASDGARQVAERSLLLDRRL